MLHNITGIKYSACNFEQHKIRMNRPIYFRGGNSFLFNFTYTEQPGQNVLGQILVNYGEFVRKNQTVGMRARQQHPDDRNARR